MTESVRRELRYSLRLALIAGLGIIALSGLMVGSRSMFFGGSSAAAFTAVAQAAPRPLDGNATRLIGPRPRFVATRRQPRVGRSTPPRIAPPGLGSPLLDTTPDAANAVYELAEQPAVGVQDFGALLPAQFRASVPNGPLAPPLPLTGSNPFGTAAVPEPATWLSMIVGFFALGAVLRRRRGGAPGLALN